MAIELDLLITSQNDHWVKEVMARTVQSSLYVSGCIDGKQSGPRTFLASLFNENWERIRRVDISVARPHHLNPGTWNALLRPSAELEIIRIQIQDIDEWYPRVQPDGEDYPSLLILPHRYVISLYRRCQRSGSPFKHHG